MNSAARKPKKKVTLTSLDVRVNNLDVRVCGLDHRLANVEVGLNSLSKTVDDLARSTADGFARMDTNFELVMKEKLRMNDRIDSIENTLSPLVRSDALQDWEIAELHKRVARLEKKYSK